MAEPGPRAAVAARSAVEPDPAGTGPAASDRPGAPDLKRPPRSYVLRRSHFSAAQRDAYERLMPRFGLAPTDHPIDPATVFGRVAPTVLEIGFGMGATTAELAAARPDWNFIGVEVHTPGVGALLKLIEAAGLTNLRVIECDVEALLERQIADASLTGVHVYFPDPWPKARHHKRRLIKPAFVEKLYRKLVAPGYLHCATDWPDYALQMREVLAASPFAAVVEGGTPYPPSAGPFAGVIEARPKTKFEQRGLKLGHPICDLLAIKPAG